MPAQISGLWILPCRLLLHAQQAALPGLRAGQQRGHAQTESARQLAQKIGRRAALSAFDLMDHRPGNGRLFREIAERPAPAFPFRANARGDAPVHVNFVTHRATIVDGSEMATGRKDIRSPVRGEILKTAAAVEVCQLGACQICEWRTRQDSNL